MTRDQIKSSLFAAFDNARDKIRGEREDVEAFYQELADRLTVHIENGSMRGIKAVGRRTVLWGERLRIRATQIAWAEFRGVVVGASAALLKVVL